MRQTEGVDDGPKGTGRLSTAYSGGFAANQCGELWLAVSAEDGSVICESRDELIKVLPTLEMALVFNLGLALGVPVEQKGRAA